MNTQKCTALNADGSPCQAYAQAGKAFCFQHDPEQAEAAAEARKRGGETRAAQLSGAVVEKLDSPEAVREYLARVCRDVEAGLIEPKRGTAISNLARVQLQALKYEDIAAYHTYCWGTHA